MNEKTWLSSEFPLARAPYLLTWKSAAWAVVMRPRKKKMMNVADLEIVGEDIVEWFDENGCVEVKFL